MATPLWHYWFVEPAFPVVAFVVWHLCRCVGVCWAAPPQLDGRAFKYTSSRSIWFCVHRIHHHHHPHGCCDDNGALSFWWLPPLCVAQFSWCWCGCVTVCLWENSLFHLSHTTTQTPSVRWGAPPPEPDPEPVQARSIWHTYKAI